MHRAILRYKGNEGRGEGQMRKGVRIKGGRTELNIKSEKLEGRQGKHGGTIFEASIMKTLLKGVSHL